MVLRLGAPMIWHEFEFQGQRVRVPALKSAGKLWFHWKGETHVVDLNEGRRRGGGSGSVGQPGVILAPMPGKITRVACKTGETVNKGQTLVVMEAMKMEYTLEADRSGVVAEVNALVGQQVALGTVLVRVVEK